MNCVLCPRKFSKFIFAVFFLYFGYCILKKLQNCTVIYAGKDVLSDLPAVRIYGIKDGARTLDTVKNVFMKLGYRIEASNFSHWDIFWSHTYPFYSLRKEFLSLKDCQKVNHFPGSGIMTQKKNLVSLHLPETPKSFLMPSQKEIFLHYAKSNANKFWMMKSSNHRGIRILNGSEELNKPKTFVQEYIHKPLLISGRKFDIGVYVMLTSIDPLRVYVYYDEVLLRFCTKKYLPFNINLVESYVIGDDYLPVWEVPDLKPYYVELNYTAKESLNAYLHAKGKSGDRLWSQIFKIVQNVYFASEAKMLETAMSFGSIRNFFELVRFDFVADELLTVYLLEVNMSPNLSPAHFPQNSLLYEQVTFSSLQLVGLVRKIHSEFCSWGEIEVSERDLFITAQQCYSIFCQKSCQSIKCKLCKHCLQREWRQVLRSAYLEHLNRGRYRRAIPPPLVKGVNKPVQRNLTLVNSLMDLWFKGKCLQDSSWCQ